MSDVSIEQPKRRGRPPGSRNVRPHREPEVMAVRPKRDGHVEAIGMNGEVLSRKRSGNVDPFAVPPHLIPDGWDYQWNPVSVTGMPATDLSQQMWENGWRPVPCGRHPGVFMPEDAAPNGPIIRGGLRLECRPMALSEEARVEEKLKADAQVKDQNALLSGKVSERIGKGFEARNFVKGRPVRQTIDTTNDAPRPALQIDPD